MDAFHADPVEELKETLRQPYFVTLNYGIIFGEKYRRKKNMVLLEELNLNRAKNVAAGIKFKTQLQSEFTGEISTVIQMANALANGEVKDEEEQFNAFWATINLQGQLSVWEIISGKSCDLDGLVQFYKSDYNTKCPYVNLSCNLYAKIMINPQPIRTGDPMDIVHIATLMPYSDLYITDKAWCSFLKKMSFDKIYNTNVCYIGDTDIVEAFFGNLNKNRY